MTTTRIGNRESGSVKSVARLAMVVAGALLAGCSILGGSREAATI
jgi:hypothetical protein